MKTIVSLAVVTALFMVSACKEENEGPEKFAGCTGGLSLQGSYDPDSVAVFVPTAFTPNADGLNDLFGVFGIGISELSYVINVGGSVVFEGDSPGDLWDGKINGAAYSGPLFYAGTIKTSQGDSLHIQGTAHSLTQKDASVTSNCDGCTFPDQIEPAKGFIRPTQENLANCR